MKTVLVIGIAVLGAWILLLTGLRGMAALLRKQTVKAAEAALDGETILRLTDKAGYAGALFPGPNLPPRTTGVLALTKNRLFFLPWFPRKAITIPHSTIRMVESRASFGGRSYKVPVLAIVVKGVGDPDGAMGWVVQDADDWLSEIQGILGRGPHG